MHTYITKAQYNKVKKYFEVKSKRPRTYPPFSILNGILHILVTGSQWRRLPLEYPPYKTVYYHFSIWKRNKVLHLALHFLTKNKDTRLLIIDNQSISDSDLPSSIHKGYDGYKKRKGRKRCLLTDTTGCIHCVRYFSANTHDTVCARTIIEYYRETPLGRSGKSITLYGDKGFHSPEIKRWCRRYRVNYQPIPRITIPNLKTKTGWELWSTQYGYITDSIKQVRWVVERTFAWLQKYRRLNMNYERTMSSLEAFTILAGIRMILRRSRN
jgi:putative transposase